MSRTLKGFNTSTLFKSAPVANRVGPPCGTRSRIRTDTGGILSPLSLPLDYAGRRRVKDLNLRRG